ncbi:MAG: carbon starvation protein A [Polyangiales bacterium]
MAAWIALGALACFALGYRYYARWLGRRVYRVDEPIPTPAHTQADGCDFVPTRVEVLFGHHYTSIAGAAPIIGPCIAAYWGWLPAILWIVLGTLFIGAVHDFGALVASVREGGRSVADLAANMLGKRGRILFMLFVLVLVWLVLAVFAMAIAGLFLSQPGAVLPVHSSILVALAVGWLLYRRGMQPLLPSLVALALLYAMVFAGTAWPLSLQALGLSPRQSYHTWITLLLLYSAIASLLPVWVLLQPRDYVNSHQLLVGLALIFAGLFWAHPDLDAPAWRSPTDDAPPLFPLLFVTIACGAVSGFHGLVASGTTSKQLDRLPHARAIGYGGMLGEGALALAVALAAVAGIALAGESVLPAQGPVQSLSWSRYYDSWAHTGTNKATAFVLGAGAFLHALGIPETLAQTLIAVLIISFAATSLDTATRIQRLILQELGTALHLAPLRQRHIATALAVLPAWGLVLWEVPTATGSKQGVGWLLWPLFGASNQMLAALTLFVLTLYFRRRGTAVLALFIPMLLVTLMTLAALLTNLRTFWQQGQALLSALSATLLALVLWMLGEGLYAWRNPPQGPLR